MNCRAERGGSSDSFRRSVMYWLMVSGALLEHVSYRTLFPYAVTFSLIALVTMAFVRHGDSKPLPAKSKLEMLDVDAD